jgi:hypothetical protein
MVPKIHVSCRKGRKTICSIYDQYGSFYKGTVAESKHKVNYSGKWDYSIACLIHIGVLKPEHD